MTKRLLFADTYHEPLDKLSKISTRFSEISLSGQMKKGDFCANRTNFAER